MPMPMTLEQAERLRQSGMIAPETFDMMYPASSTEPAAVPSDLPESSPPPPAPAPETDRFKQLRGEALAEREAREAAAKAQQDALDAQADDEEIGRLQGRIKDKSSWFKDEKQARTELAPEISRLEQLESRRAQRKPTMQPASMQTADMPQGAAPANVVLASDRQPDSGQQIRGSAGEALNQMLAPDLAGYQMQEQGIRAAASAGQAKAAEESAYLERMQSEDADRIESMRLNDMSRQAKLDGEFKKMDEAANSFAASKIDPDRYWANKTTGDKVVAGIGLFLGAFGPNGNRAADVIQAAINRDIEVQKANIDIKKDAFTARSGIYSKMLDTFKDRRAAEEATRIAYLQNTELKIKAISSKYAGQEVGAKAQMLLGELELKKTEARQRFAASIMAAMPIDPDMDAEMLKDPDKRDRFVKGYGLAQTKDEASKFREQVSNAGSAVRELGRLLEIADMSGKSLSPDLRGEAQTRANMLTGLLKDTVVGPGTISDKDRELLKEVAVNPTEITKLDSATKSRLRTAIDVIQKNLAMRAQSIGLTSPEKRLGFETADK